MNANARRQDIRELAERLAFALGGYHGGRGVSLDEERELLVEAANVGLLPLEWIEPMGLNHDD